MKFSIGSIPVKIYPLFWFLIFGIGWINTFSLPATMVWGVVIFFSVLIHELGHALTALYFGQKVHIELYGMGGMTHRHGSKLSLWKEFFIVLDGPIAGFLLFIIVSQFGVTLRTKPDSLIILGIQIAMYVNLVWTLLNLIPILPLDGGHLMRIIFEGIFGLRGVKIAYFISMVFAGLLGMFFFNIGDFFFGALTVILAFESYRVWKSTLALTRQDQDVTLQLRLHAAEREMRQGNVNGALAHLEELRGMTKEGLIYNSATEHMAEILAHQSKYKEAFEVLYPLRSKIRPEMWRLLHQVAYRSGKWQEAITIGNQSFQYNPSYDTAVINALCHAIIGDAIPAIGWLRCAIDEGLPNPEEILSKREFDHIRENPDFQALINKPL